MRRINGIETEGPPVRRRARGWVICWIAVLGLSVAGCATRSDMVALHDRLVSLERDSVELQQRNEAVQRENDTLRSRLESVARTREEKELKLLDQSAGLRATLDGFREDIQTLNGKVEVINHDLRTATRRLDEADAEMGRRLLRIEGYLDVGRPVSGSSGMPAPPSPQAPDDARTERTPVPPSPSESPDNGDDPSGGLSPAELYHLAKAAFDRGNYEEAQEGFRTLIKQYPRSPNADNSQFWIGEIYYRQRRYEESILEYQTVIERYPDGNKVRAALLKQGFAFYSLGDRGNARLILDELIRKYPSSNEAKIAQEKLDGF
jgi:tol-pal system protein YbgF